MKNPCLGSQIVGIELQSRHIVLKKEPEGPQGGLTAAKGRPQQPPMSSQDTFLGALWVLVCDVWGTKMTPWAQFLRKIASKRLRTRKL